MLGTVNYADYFYICETSQTNLRWKVKPSKKIQKDSIAGNLDTSTGYFRIGLRGKLYYVHRIVMILSGYIIDNLEIDHIDGVRTNNLLQNLRVVTRAGNTRNRKKSSNNSTGITGVYLNVKRRKGGLTDQYWCAEWHDSVGKKHSKCFSVKKLGFELAKKLATQLRLSQIVKVNEKLPEFEYTDRHLNKE